MPMQQVDSICLPLTQYDKKYQWEKIEKNKITHRPA